MHFLRVQNFTQEWLSGKKWIISLTLLSIILLPFLWVPPGFLEYGEETATNFETLIYKARYAWTQDGGYGAPATTTDHCLLIPNAIFYFALKSAGLSNALVQKLFFSFIITLIIISFYIFSSLFTKKKWVFFLSLLVYYLNFYILHSLTYTAKVFQLILMPLLFYLTYQYLFTHNGKYIAYHFVTLFFLQGIFTNMPQVAATFLVYPLAIVYFVLTNKQKLAQTLLRFTIFILILIPILLYQGLVYTSLDLPLIKNRAAGFQPLTSPLQRIMQFRGAWWEEKELRGVPYDHWYNFYNNRFIILITFGFLISVLYLILIKNPTKKSTFWLLTFLFFTALSSGTTFQPSIYKWLFQNVPEFWIFREPWAKFIPLVIFSFSTLTIFSFQTLNRLSKKRPLYKLIYLLLILVIIIKSFPFFSTHFYYREINSWKKILIKPPPYWYEYKEWSKDIGGKNILPLPFSDNQLDWFYNWYNEGLGNSSANLPVIFGAPNVFLPILQYGYGNIMKGFVEAENFDFIKLNRVNYVLIQDDIKIVENQELYNWQKNKIKEYINPEPIKSWGGKLFLYQIRKDYLLPHIYAPKVIKTTDKNFEALPKIVSEKSYNILSAIYFQAQNQDKQNLLKTIPPQINQPPTIEFKRISPVKYRVHIHNAQENFILLFSEAFHKSWKVYLSEIKNDNLTQGQFYETWLQKPFISDQNHLLANGYVNSWWINLNDIRKTGNYLNNDDGSMDFEIIIEYRPQRLFTLVLLISILMLISCLGYILYKKIRVEKSHYILDTGKKF